MAYHFSVIRCTDKQWSKLISICQFYIYVTKCFDRELHLSNQEWFPAIYVISSFKMYGDDEPTVYSHVTTFILCGIPESSFPHYL